MATAVTSKDLERRGKKPVIVLDDANLDQRVVYIGY